MSLGSISGLNCVSAPEFGVVTICWHRSKTILLVSRAGTSEVIWIMNPLKVFSIWVS